MSLVVGGYYLAISVFEHEGRWFARSAYHGIV